MIPPREHELLLREWGGLGSSEKSPLHITHRFAKDELSDLGLLSPK